MATRRAGRASGCRSAATLLVALAMAASACGPATSGTPTAVTGSVSSTADGSTGPVTMPSASDTTVAPANTTAGHSATASRSDLVGSDAASTPGPMSVTRSAPDASSPATPAASSDTTASSPTAVPTSAPDVTPARTSTARTTTSSHRATTSTRTTATATSTSTSAAFHSSIARIDGALAARMSTSYHDGCPVSLADLRYLRLTYWGFDNRPHTGELVVSARVAEDVVTAFRSLFAHRFPIRQMRLVDDFGGSDDDSMAADNTSAFNCRPVTGGSGWSEHSYGEAIDVNPVQNPYLSGSTVLPPAGRAFLDRPDEPGVIHAGDVAVQAFAAIGWTWGGTWTSPVDLQHFSRSGR